MNKVILIGNVGKQPEVKNFDGGIVAKFSLATSETRKDKSGTKVKETEWHRVVAFGKTAEVVQKYVQSGSLLSIEGKIRTSSYQHEGVQKYSTEIICQNMKMLGSKPEQKIEQAVSQAHAASLHQNEGLPF